MSFYNFFRNISIKNKLRAISIIISIVVLVVSSLVLVINEIYSLKRNMSTDTLILADILGRNASAGLIFGDESSVQDTLASVSANPNITNVQVFTPQGTLFVRYPSVPNISHDILASYFPSEKLFKQFKENQEVYFFTDTHLTVFKYAILNDKELGIIHIESDLEELNQRLYWYLAVLFIDMVLSLGLALILAARLQTLFTQPVYALLNTITTVTKDSNYALRAEKISKDEIGKLIDGFNKMLSVIEIRDEQIKALNQRLNSENIRMSSELDITKRMQRMVLPSQTELTEIKELDIVGFMKPADEVGGDYYDVLREGNHIKIGIGDVTGHGLESGVIMLMVQTAVRTLLLAGIKQAEEFLNIVNRTIYANVCRMDSDKNLTLALLDYHDGNIIVTGQHEEVLVMRHNGSSEWVSTFNLGYMVGLQPNIQRLIASTEIRLEPGDGIVLYTDGITEAHDVEAEQAVYGEERLRAIVSQHWHQSVEEIRDAVISDVLAYAGSENIFDDLTLLVIRRI